jgi:hypothetical protein
MWWVCVKKLAHGQHMVSVPCTMPLEGYHFLLREITFLLTASISSFGKKDKVHMFIRSAKSDCL